MAESDTLDLSPDPPDPDIPGVHDDVDLPDEVDEPEEVVEYDPIEPLTVYTPSAYRKVTVDSLSRWQLWSHQGEWVTRQPGVIAYQLGGLGRNDGYMIRGHESRHQQVFRDGIPVNERIFGSANRKRLPHYSRLESIHEFSSPIRYRTDITTMRYHVDRPLTFINYEQTSYDYRSTEGFLTRNFTPRTNLSMAYWGKNQSEGYRNNTMGGRNAAVTLYHFLNNSWMIEGGVHYSGLQFGEPDGYQIGNMFTFPFSRFEAIPNEAFAESSMRNALFRVMAYHRKSKDHEANTRITLYHDRYRRSHYNESDSSFVRTQTSGVTGRHILLVGPLELQGELLSEWTMVDRDRFQTMNIDSWAYSRAKGMVTLPLPNRSELNSWMQAGWRTDDFIDYEIGSKVNLRLFGGLSLYGSYARGEQLPHPGQLYWMRPPVSGNPDLQNEVIQRAETGIRYHSGALEIGGEVHASRFNRPVLVGADSLFVQAGSYTSAGTTGWLTLDTDRIELSLSGTFQQYFSDDFQTENQLLDLSGLRIWTRASFFYKNYVFNSAAFMKAGFYVQASPTVYRTATYYPSMDYWDPNSWNPNPVLQSGQEIPEFVRLDFDLTARVRSVIFLFRMENALDNWLLPGYFETAYQPMPSRRLRFGIRWVLRN